VRTVLAKCVYVLFISLGVPSIGFTQSVTALQMTSDPGDYIGQGLTYLLTPSAGNFSVLEPWSNEVQIRFAGGSVNWWYLTFQAPNGARLAPGAYEGATRWPFQSPTAPGLDVSGNGRGCNRSNGRFVVHEVTYGAEGLVERFAADFEQHCEGVTPAFRGSIRFNATASPLMFIDAPAAGRLPRSFPVSGWAVDRRALTGAGISTIHVWAVPTTPGQAPVFLGVAQYGQIRPDVGAIFGAQFSASGFSLSAADVPVGEYELAVFGQSSVTGQFDLLRTARITVTSDRTDMRASVDSPVAGSQVRQPFSVSGWALDALATSGTGVDAIHVWAYSRINLGAPPIFVGQATLGIVRQDVANLFGARFATSGFNLNVHDLLPGPYLLVVFARSTVTGTFTPYTREIEVTPSAELHIDEPLDQSVVDAGAAIRGWAVDTGGATGTGIDAVHVWAFPVDRTTTPFLIGPATYHLSRPDVGARLGERYTLSGFELMLDARLPAGTYDIVAFAYREGNAAARAARLIRITKNGS